MSLRAALALVVALPALAAAEIHVGTTRIADLYLGDTRICDAWLGDRQVHAVGSPPVVSAFTASQTTFRASELPANVTLTWATSGITEGSIVLIDREGVAHQIIAFHSSAPSGSEQTPVFATCASAGCRYVLHAENTAETGCSRDTTADLRVRVVTAPTLTAFAASALTSHQGPFTFSQCSTLTWTSTAGDPAATWALTLSGYYVSVLPGPLHLGPGQSGQRVCIHDTVHSGQNTTTLTLTGTNEAGTASRSATITWAGGVGPGG